MSHLYALKSEFWRENSNQGSKTLHETWNIFSHTCSSLRSKCWVSDRKIPNEAHRFTEQWKKVIKAKCISSGVTQILPENYFRFTDTNLLTFGNIYICEQLLKEKKHFKPKSRIRYREDIICIRP